MPIVIPAPEAPTPWYGSSAELSIQRRLTHEFILTQPHTVALTPRAKAETDSGGFAWTSQPARDDQVMRLIEPSKPNDPVRTADGIEREVAFILLGEWNAVIGVNDIFDVDGYSYEVVSLYHFNGWEQRAAVARYG